MTRLMTHNVAADVASSEDVHTLARSVLLATADTMPRSTLRGSSNILGSSFSDVSCRLTCGHRGACSHCS